VNSLPDILEIKPLAKPPNCTITVPGSKSITNRALILAALAKGKCVLRGALWADDTQVMVDSLKRLGFKISHTKPDADSNVIIEIEGCDGTIPVSKADLYVGNAGTAARFLTALVCLGHGEYRIAGDPRMHERPMRDLFDALGSLGASIETQNGHLPALVRANGLRRGQVEVSVEHSSQFASALLLVSQHAGLDVTMKSAGDVDDHSYFRLTASMMLQPPRSGSYDIEPDLSSASYFDAIAWIHQTQIPIVGKPAESLQIDGNFPRFLPLLKVGWQQRHQNPHVAQISRMTQLGDSVMTLGICALFGDTPVRVKHASRLRVQECDRITAMVTELKRVGAKVEEHLEGFTVWPAEAGQLHGAEIETYKDHRMAMCFAVLGLKVPGIRIKNPACVSKTFPNFFEKLEQLRS